MTPTKPRSEKYWRHVVKGPGCWAWTGDLDWKGYARIREQVNCSRKWLLAHRISWEIHYGPIPTGMKILHKCDNPPCTRPDHLFVGTVKLNAQDAVAKGRIRLPGAKLTSDQRQWAMSQRGRMSYAQIAARLDVSKWTIGRLFRCETWDMPLQVYKKHK